MRTSTKKSRRFALVVCNISVLSIELEFLKGWWLVSTVQSRVRMGGGDLS